MPCAQRWLYEEDAPPGLGYARLLFRCPNGHELKSTILQMNYKRDLTDLEGSVGFCCRVRHEEQCSAHFFLMHFDAFLQKRDRMSQKLTDRGLRQKGAPKARQHNLFLGCAPMETALMWLP